MLPAPTAVVCHDAGATNLMIRWLAGHVRNGDIRVCAEGPARDLWRAKHPGIAFRSLDDAMDGAASLLSGTGWASDLEHRARTVARKFGIPSAAVIDHWVNYCERFERGGATVLPDEIWVADRDAFALAARKFPGLAIREMPNLYLRELVAEVERCNPLPPRNPPRNVLYVLEPIRRSWGDDARPGELQAFDYFAGFLRARGLCGVDLVLRPHPSDLAGKYDAWPARLPEVRIVVDLSASLAEQIARADWVVGCDSFALVIALEAGRRVFCTLPPHAPARCLPHADIREVRNMWRADA